MSNTDHIVPITQFFLGIGVLILVYGYMYRRTKLDRLREDIFTIRDELFDYMWQHDLSYQLPAYHSLRDYLNGLIRVARFFYFPSLSCVALLFLVRRKQTSPRLPSMVAAIPDPVVKIHFQNVYCRATLRLAHYLFLEGPQWLIFKPFQMIVLPSGSVGMLGKVKKLGQQKDQVYRNQAAQRKQKVESIVQQPLVVAVNDEIMRLGESKSPERNPFFEQKPRRFAHA